MKEVEKVYNVTSMYFYKNNSSGVKNKSKVFSSLFAKYAKERDNGQESGKKSSEYDVSEIGLALRDAVDSIFDPTDGMTEEEKKEFIDKLERKIKNGDKLTADEMQYLRINNPVEYAKMARVQQQRVSLETQLKNCSSKQEAHELYTNAVARAMGDSFARGETIAAYNNVYEEFKESDKYMSLPQNKKH